MRPLSLTDIFNGAASYIRANTKATLGLTAIVVVTTQIITLIATVGPLAAASRLRTAPADELTGGYMTAWLLSPGSPAWSAGWPASYSPACSRSSSAGRCSAGQSAPAKRGPGFVGGCPR